MATSGKKESQGEKNKRIEKELAARGAKITTSDTAKKNKAARDAKADRLAAQAGNTTMQKGKKKSFTAEQELNTGSGMMGGLSGRVAESIKREKRLSKEAL